MRALFFRIIGFACGTIFWPSSLSGQPLLPEHWEGMLTQTGTGDTFRLAIHLRQNGDLVTGESVSTSSGKKTGRFSLAGRWDGQTLLIQEIEQLEPKGERWCLKYFTLRKSAESTAAWTLSGPWKAESCPSGMALLNPLVSGLPVALAPEVPFSLEGLWTGHLSQSDRDYGFYFETSLQADGKGTSSIVSESNGGQAYHRLNWAFSPADSILEFRELDIVRKTSPNWKWCIKNARLRLSRQGSRYVMEGDWNGFIEGRTPATGPCAPGRLYLERPMLALADSLFVSAPLPADSLDGPARETKLERQIDVYRPDLKIKVWDNGTEDGDIVSLFLNGKRIAHRFRITKGKASVQVRLQQEFNLLVLFAEDIGTIVPNTVAISIDDGVKEHILVLNADLTHNGAVLIRQFSVKQ
ncbi:MAG: hypothetical protein IPH16_06390 [Haliscomenobacter sp.]|nr:hypothetical protein [Haliscomenobacter sp.]